MKKVLVVLMVAVLAVGLAACGEVTTRRKRKSSDKENESVTTTTNESVGGGTWSGDGDVTTNGTTTTTAAEPSVTVTESRDTSVASNTAVTTTTAAAAHPTNYPTTASTRPSTAATRPTATVTRPAVTTTTTTTSRPTTTTTTTTTTKKNEYFNANVSKSPVYGKIIVRPYQMYWEGSVLVIRAYIINGRDATVDNVFLDRLVVTGEKGTVASGSFGRLYTASGIPLSLRSGGYVTWTFRLGGGAVMQAGADLTRPMQITSTFR